MPVFVTLEFPKFPEAQTKTIIHETKPIKTKHMKQNRQPVHPIVRAARLTHK